jgi:hypothetical protein
MHFTHAAAMNAEILGEAVHSPAIDGAVASDNSIAEGVVKKHAVIGGSVRDKSINFDEGILVKKHAHAVTCGASPACPDGFLPLESATEPGLLSLELKVFETFTRVPCHTLSTPSRFLIETLSS